MGVWAHVIEDALGAQIIKDSAGHVQHQFTGQPAKVVDKVALFIQRGDHRQAKLLAQFKVLGAAARGNVHDARAFILADLVPQDDAMRLHGVLLHVQLQRLDVCKAARQLGCWQVIKGAVIGPALHVSAF